MNESLCLSIYGNLSNKLQNIFTLPYPDSGNHLKVSVKKKNNKVLKYVSNEEKENLQDIRRFVTLSETKKKKEEKNISLFRRRILKKLHLLQVKTPLFN